jgi:hypothetical protein
MLSEHLVLTSSSATPFSLAMTPPLKKFVLAVLGGLPIPPSPGGISVGNGNEKEPLSVGKPVGKGKENELGPPPPPPPTGVAPPNPE